MNTVPLLSRTDFGDAMRKARLERGLSQRSLADLAEIDKETINRVENGANTRIDTLKKIREALPNMSMNGEAYANGSFAKTTTVTDTHVVELRERIMHLVHAVTSPNRLRRIESCVLRAVIAQHKPTAPKRPSTKKRKHRS
jgi:transcriptional regulator with XRE-family HTH domain